MPLSPGKRLGPYEILSPLGAGGMGEVYLARDTRLDRTVAVKVLPAPLSTSPELRQRFEREARSISSLNHPHICALYDIGHEDGIDYLVMEHLEGETLANRLVRGALTAREMLSVAIQVADALEKAHRQGVVHRDLKPGNIMLTRTGAKLLDFGLAKIGGGPSSSSQLTTSPTLVTPLTAEGSIIGTFQYMAPEQLEGREADSRTDIFAFGAVLYEMATGRRAFEGKSRASLIAAIMTAEPPAISSIQPLTPPALDRAVSRALTKNPDDRWQTARDLRGELEWIAEGGSQAGAPAHAVVGPGWRGRAGWIVAATLLAVLAVSLPSTVIRLARDPDQPPLTRFIVAAPEKTAFGDSFSLSHDGRKLAFVAAKEGKNHLWVRALESLDARQLEGTENAVFPFWSPDGRFIGFFAEGKLKKVDVATGAVQSLCDANDSRGAAWSRDGVILFTPNYTSPLFSIASSGGAPIQVTKLDDVTAKESSHRWPSFLPDGRHFVYFARAGSRGESKIYLGSLDSEQRRELVASASGAAYALPGYLFYMVDGNLLARPFDASRLEFMGEPVLLAETVQRFGELGPSGYGAFSVSQSGTLAYRSGETLTTQLAWFDRRGARLESVGPPGRYDEPALSRDGRRIAVGRSDPNGSSDIWILDLSRGTFSRLTFDPATDATPVWSPEGDRIVYSSNRAGPFSLFWRLSSGAGDEEQILGGKYGIWPDDWSSDGRFILYEESGPDTAIDLAVLPASGERKPSSFLKTKFSELHGQFSPDGRWVAYTSDESGRTEVYVQPFPPEGGKWQISVDGGGQASWRRDGREIFYVTPGRDLMAVSVSTQSGFKAGIPERLFTLSTPDLGLTNSKNNHVVAADGQRILVNALSQEDSPPIIVVLNWASMLKK